MLWRPGWRGVSVSWAAGPRLFAVAVRVVSSRVSAYPRIVCRVATNTRAMMYYVTVLYFLGEALKRTALPLGLATASRGQAKPSRTAKGISPHRCGGDMCVYRFIFLFDRGRGPPIFIFEFAIFSFQNLFSFHTTTVTAAAMAARAGCATPVPALRAAAWTAVLYIYREMSFSVIKPGAGINQNW